MQIQSTTRAMTLVDEFRFVNYLRRCIYSETELSLMSFALRNKRPGFQKQWPDLCDSEILTSNTTSR